MLKKVFFILLPCILLTGCVTGPEGYLKKSANNRLFDMKGFKGGKRTPLYNKKYIAKAKKNIESGIYYDDDDLLSDINTEDEDIALANREMYRDMIEQDRERLDRKKNGWSLFSSNKNNRRKYPSTSYASKKMRDNAYQQDDLREELQQIKTMLHEAKRDLSSYKCPSAANLERDNLSKPNIRKPKSVKIKRYEEDEDNDDNDNDNDMIGSNIIEPVLSM